MPIPADDPNPLICGTGILTPPPRRVPLFRHSMELHTLLWIIAGLILGTLIGVPGWIAGFPWMTFITAILGAFTGMVISQITVMGLRPTAAVTRKGAWILRPKPDQAGEEAKAAVYVGLCGPLKESHLVGTPIRVHRGYHLLLDDPIAGRMRERGP